MESTVGRHNTSFLIRLCCLGFILAAGTREIVVAQPAPATKSTKAAESPAATTPPAMKADSSKPAVPAPVIAADAAKDAPSPVAEAKKAAAASEPMSGTIPPREADQRVVAGPDSTGRESGFENRPTATLQQLTLSGQMLKQSAELKAEFEIRVHSGAEQWVRVPLGLREAAWTAKIDYEGEGEQIVHFDREADEYVLWLKAEPKTRHLLKATLIVPVAGAGQERRLALSLPNSGASSLRLIVNAPRVVVVESRGTPPPEVRTLDGQHARIEVLGPQGDYLLNWRELDQSSASNQPILESNGWQRIRMDGRTIATQAKLTVRSFGTEFDRLRVKLPPKSVLAGLPGKGMTLSTVPGSNGETIEVLLDAKTAGPIEIPLQTERIVDVTKPNEPVELAGFEVLEALPHRQGGFIGVEVVGDWQIIWGKMSRVRSSIEFPNKPADLELAAIWEYVGQPYHLEARLQARKTVSNVDVENTLNFTERGVELTTNLRYQVRGARLGSAEIQIPGWTLDEIGPENLINKDAVLAGTGDQLQIPFVNPVLGTAQLTLRAHRDFEPSDKVEVIQLPLVQADVLGAQILRVRSADQVQLEPQDDKFSQLRLILRPASEIVGELGELLYRVEKQPGIFATKIAVLPKRTRALSMGRCTVTPSEVKIEQELEYRVSGGVLDKVQVASPASMPGHVSIAWMLDGKRVEPSGLPRYQEQDKQWIWTLPVEPPRRESLVIKAEYRLPQVLGADQTAVLAIPLLTPIGVENLRQELVVTPQPGVELGLARLGKAWRATNPDQTGPRVDAFTLNSDTPQSDLTLTGQLQSLQTRAAAIVERTWMQTWLGDSERLERVVFRLRGSTGPEQIELPAGIIPNSVQVLWNGVPLGFQQSAEHVLTPAYPVSESDAAQFLELIYHFDRVSYWSVAAEFPRLRGAIWNSQCYWQILAPNHWTLLGMPAGWSNEMTWQWTWPQVGREPNISQAQLENWLGLPHEDALSSSSQEYLFSTIGQPRATSVWLIPRALLLWGGAAVGFGLGVLVWSVRWLRHPLMFIPIAVAIAAAGSLFPEPVLLLAQVALLGVPLLGIAALLHRYYREPPAATEPAKPRTAVPKRGLDRPSTQFMQTPIPPAHGSTATAALPGKVEQPAS